MTTNPPFGYDKNADNPQEWIVDETAANVVRRIFNMCVAGYGPTQIAKRLTAEKIPTPNEYWNSIGRYFPTHILPLLTERLSNWCRNCESIAADRHEAASSVCFRDFFTVLIVVKSSILV